MSGWKGAKTVVKRRQFLAITCLIILLVFAGLHIVGIEQRNQELMGKLGSVVEEMERVVAERQEWLLEMTEVEFGDE